MTALSRRNRLWVSLMLALAMVFTIGGAPAYAMACAEMSRSALAAPAASEKMAGCHEATQTRNCCCGPEARTGVQSARSLQQPPVAALLTQPGCGCAIQAPPTSSAPSLKAASLVLAQDLAFLPGSPTALQLAAPAVWAYAVSANGPPQSDVRSSGPSRAPPAC